MNDSQLIDRIIRGWPLSDKRMNAQILALYEYGWTGQEIADYFGLSLNAIQARASRERRRIKDDLARGTKAYEDNR